MNYRVTFDSLFGKEDMSSSDVHHVVANFDSKLKEVRSQGKHELSDVAARLWEYFSSVEVPNQAKAIAGLALLYFILPYDLVPDATPILGYADDLAMMVMATRKIAALVGMAKVARSNVRDHYGMGG